MSSAKKKAEVENLKHSMRCLKVVEILHIVSFVHRSCSQEFKNLPEKKKNIEIEAFLKNHKWAENTLLEFEEKLKQYAIKART